MVTNIKVIIGANFGDEGKGLMADYFADEIKRKNESCLNVLSNGGAQRGHTVITPEGDRHVFKHFGSGTFAGAHTYMPSFFIVNPMLFRQEWEKLKNPVVFVDPRCLCSTPYDMMLNQIIEEARGKNRHGSCGIGIWETIVRHGLTIGELSKMTNDQLKRYLNDIREKYVVSRLKQLGFTTNEWYSLVYDNGILEHFIEDLHFFLSITSFTNPGILNLYQNIIFENGQGLMLDKDIKGYGENGKYATPSSTGLKNPAYLINNYIVNPGFIEVCYISRTYQTRHGAGRFDSECPKEYINKDMVDETNQPNPFQGNLRYGMLDYQDLFERCEEDFKKTPVINAKKSIVFTHTNEFPLKCPTYQYDYYSDGKTRESVHV